MRDNNEDAVLVRPDLGLAVLADGMGGYNAGEVASEMATRLLVQYLEGLLGDGPAVHHNLRHHLQCGVAHANLAIYETALARPELRGMGTTLVAAAFQGMRLTVAHVGDSRLYRLRQGSLTPLTRDHSILQEQIDAGLMAPENARHAPFRNLVTRAVGVEPQVDVEVAEHVVQPGDTYLLCSDGLNDMLTDPQMAHILKTEPGLVSAGQSLLQHAIEFGGRDNISLVLVQCSPAPRSYS